MGRRNAWYSPLVPSVAVLVELLRRDTSGGQVKCWEHFAQSATHLPERVPTCPGGTPLDLTVYFLGERERVEHLAPHVRLVMLRPVLSSAAMRSAEGAEDVCDLAPWHPRLAVLLPRHDVWHLTHSFAFAATAVRLDRRAARRSAARPRLIASVHTDVPLLSSVYARYLARRWLPGTHPAVDDLFADRVENRLRRRRDRLLDHCERVLVPTPEGRAELGRALGPDRVVLLRRGIDHALFRPDPAARARLVREYGVPADRPLVLFAGRLDATKGVPLLTESLRLLRARGGAAHLVTAGTGAEENAVRRTLGPDVTLLGPLPQDRLARVYAGCDIFAFPSRTETSGNVVAEAMASGLAVVLPEGAHTTRWLAAPGRDGIVVPADDPSAWADALRPLVEHPAAREAVRRRAAVTSRTTHPTWDRVLEEDLLPVWTPPAPAPRHPGSRTSTRPERAP
ncbi:glycoside hydrolase [Streptomyces toyocaensis]|uniref:Glycoside hydrolase n=1 Tax=Streptomyces toyocaensis TaxID=55952 RepID=A0A081XSH3_STRTO|nr:glycoside hydrolase [Streptomyces toyocaensis]